MNKIAERVFWLTPHWSIITEMRIREKFWVLFPTVIIFTRGSEGPHLDFTAAWLVFGFTLRKE